MPPAPDFSRPASGLVTVLIGEGPLALHCLNTLAAQGLAPAWIGSFDGSLEAAAGRLRRPHLRLRHEMAERLAREGCDHLFNVHGTWAIPPAMLHGVRRMAISFHDGPLPRYAGAHAPSWALAHGETEHGVSWHEMSAGLDSGALLVQAMLPITPQDTAFTLNARCFDAAVQSFDTLVARLKEGTWSATPQTGPRSHFSPSRRPDAQGVLDFERPAQALADQVRALDFGPQPNPLGLAKLWLAAEEPVLVRTAWPLPGPGTAAPGTLLACDAEGLLVATATSDLRLGGLACLNGEPLAQAALQARFTPRIGQLLPALDAAQRAEVSARAERICLHEADWQRLWTRGVNPAELPAALTGGQPPAWQAPAQPRPLPRFTAALACVAPAERALRSRSALAAYAVRLGRNAGPQDLGLVVPLPATQRALFAPVVPLRCPHESTASPGFTDFEAAFAAAWQEVHTLETFALDLFARTPALQAVHRPARWPWGLLVSDEPPPVALAAHVAHLFWLSSDGSGAHLVPHDDLDAGACAAIDAQLAALTHATVDAPQTPVARLPLLDAAERARLLACGGHGHPAAATAPLPETCLHTLFEEQARRTPEAPAVSFGATRLSYAELDARAGRWARLLAARGVGVGDRVALAVRRGVDMVVGLLAILKAGAAYVPVDCQHPPQRIAQLLARSRPRLVLTHAAARDVLPPADTGAGTVTEALPRLCFDADAYATLAPQPPVLQQPSPGDLAYVIFTSGSTGEPKGVEIPHRALVNHALFMGDRYALGLGDRALCSASIAFDVAAEQIYPALLRGAEVVVRPDDLLDSFVRFDRFVREQALTALTLPTAFWHEWVHDLADRGLEVPPSLRVLAVGTEKAFGDALASWQARGGRWIRFLQGYGPTEAAITCTMYQHDGTAVDAAAALPIGRPLPNTEVYLLDENLEPVPVGLPGEIHIGGVCLARGYLDRPDLTRERFIPHPFRSEPGARLYKTGDLARFAPDGQLLFIGRRDFQIKLRGFRMEPGEIEAVLRGQAGVQSCLVMLREDTPGLPRLTAYLAAPGGIGPDALRALQQRCREQLPEPMRPTAWVVLPALPVNANGKVDRTALPAPVDAATAATPADSAPPDDPVQRAVAAIFAEVLGCAAVGAQDNFFELGGNSLRAVRMLSRLQAHFAAELTLQDLLQDATVAGLARRLQAGPAPAAAATAAPSTDMPVVIELKPGTGMPVVLVAGCPIYRPLARAYEGPHPVLALLMPAEEALLRRGEALPGIPELAARYLAALRAHVPRGPYVLCGLSFGGVVAYEMAQRLAAEGEPVPQLVLFDSVLPRARRRHLAAWALKKLRHAWVRLRSTADTGPLAREALAQARMDELRHHEIKRLLVAYDKEIRPYAGPALLYRARDAREGRVQPGYGFRGLVADLTECEVPGDHLGMLDDTHAPGLAADLARRLEAIGTGCSAPAPAAEGEAARFAEQAAVMLTSSEPPSALNPA